MSVSLILNYKCCGQSFALQTHVYTIDHSCSCLCCASESKEATTVKQPLCCEQSVKDNENSQLSLFLLFCASFSLW